MVLRKAGKISTTNITVAQHDDGSWTWDYTIAFKSGNLKFKLGEPFPETTPDGRKVTVSKNVLDNHKRFYYLTAQVIKACLGSLFYAHRCFGKCS